MWIKLFRQRKIQTVMIFFVILLCTTLMNGSTTILTSMSTPYDRIKKECKPADVTVNTYVSNANNTDVETTTNSIDPNTCDASIQLQKRFEALEPVEQVINNLYSYIDDDMYVGDKKIEVYTDIVTYHKKIYGSVRVLEGKLDSENGLGEGECFIPACIKNEFNLKRGDILTIKNPRKEMNYKIVGVFVEPYSTSTAFDSAILVKSVPKEFKIQHHLKIYAKQGHTGQDIIDSYQDKYNEVFPGFISKVDESLEKTLIATNIVAALFLAMGIIMLVVSCLIINFMIRHAMITDAKTIAVYKTIGYTTNSILKMYITFYLVVVSFASALGILLSKFISKLILEDIFKNLGETSNINVLHTGIPCFLLIVGFVLLIIYLVIRKTKKVKPIYALNGLQGTNTKKQKYKNKGNINAAFSPMGIALRSILRDKKGILGVLLTSIVTIYSVNFAMISLDVANNQKQNNDYWLGIDASDVMITVSDPNNFDYVREIVNKDKRVKYSIKANHDERVLFDYSKENAITSMSTFIYEDYDKVDLPVVTGTNPKTDSEIAISTKIAKNLNKEVGDYIECYIGFNKKKHFLVSGLFQTYFQLGETCRLRSDSYTNNNVPFVYNTCSVYLKDSVDKKEFITDIKNIIGSKGKVILRTEAFPAIMNMIVTPQIQGLPPIIALVFLIGGINIFCIVMLKNSNNEKNNGIYKCIGYSTNDLLKSNLYYVSIIVVLEIAIAVPTTILTYEMIMQIALSLFGFSKYPILINVYHLSIVNACVFILFITSTILSSRSLRHVDVRDLVVE